MKTKALSIYNDYYTIKDFLFKYGFITEEQYHDDDYDLHVWLEGDCDKMVYNDTNIYFSHFHSDYEFGGCRVVICTAEWKDELKEIEEFYNGESWVWFDRGSVEEFEKLDREKYGLIWYRGGVGYIYNLYYKEF